MRKTAILAILGLSLFGCDRDTSVSPDAPTARAVHASAQAKPWARADWVGHAHNRIVNRVVVAILDARGQGLPKAAARNRAAAACRMAFVLEQLDASLCNQMAQASHSGVSATSRGPHTLDISPTGVWLTYAGQIESAVSAASSAGDLDQRLVPITSAATSDPSLTDEDLEAVFATASVASSSYYYWENDLAAMAGNPQPTPAKTLVIVDVAGGIGGLVGGVIGGLAGATVARVITGTAAGASASKFIEMFLGGDIQVNQSVYNPSYDLCTHHPGAC